MENSSIESIKIPDKIINTMYNGVTSSTIQTVKGLSMPTAYRHLAKIRNEKGKVYVSLEDMAFFYGQTLKEMIDEFVLLDRN